MCVQVQPDSHVLNLYDFYSGSSPISYTSWLIPGYLRLLSGHNLDVQSHTPRPNGLIRRASAPSGYAYRGTSPMSPSGYAYKGTSPISPSGYAYKGTSPISLSGYAYRGTSPIRKRPSPQAPLRTLGAGLR